MGKLSACGRVAVLAVVVTAMLTSTAGATTSAKNQNPDLVVVASYSPTHIDTGERATWGATIVNTTSHTIDISFEIDGSTPNAGFGIAGSGQLGAHQSLSFQRTRRARLPGTYTLVVKASDTNGTSHARAVAYA